MMNRYRFLLVFLLACIFALPVFKEQEAQAQALHLKAQRPIEWKKFLGVNAHFLWFEPNVYQQQIAQLKGLGLEWVRIDVHWAVHEPKEGQYRLSELDGVMDAAQKNHLKSVVYVVGSAPHATTGPHPNMDAYPPRKPELFADFMVMLARRYGDKVTAWQVWNEPNLPAFWNPVASPEGYGKLLKATTTALRSVYPQKPVVMGGMGYYSQMPPSSKLMFEALGHPEIIDLKTIAAYHPYSLYPEGDDPAAKDFLVFSHRLNQMLRNAKVPEIWATEWGWSSYAGPREEQPIIGVDGQADYLLRRLALMATQDFDRIFLFALSDLDARATVRDRAYGLLDQNARPKPAYRALKNFLEITGPELTPADAPALRNPPSDLIGISWKHRNNSNLLMFWGASGGSFTFPGVKQAILYAPLSGNQQSLTGGSREMKVNVLPQLQILVW
jgi:beta-xylosidase